jgi:hypothetical protein
LDGTYKFPPDTDKWTRMIQEAHHTFVLQASEKIDATISLSDFQGYWQKADESISSSFNRLHFGHYKAASFNKDLSALHAAKLTACSRKRIPLSRWGISLTILLEKTCHDNRINKMQAICLLEGDFNYFNKTIYA